MTEERIVGKPCPPLSASMSGVLQLVVPPWKTVSRVVGDMLIVGSNVQPKGSEVVPSTPVQPPGGITRKGSATASMAMGTYATVSPR
ncbi:MAG TPA: hypothetical protein VMS00_01335 [Acidimicrobiales bacterium]|nr:hypothetical protein [Acidimicrobiales bacterium]